MLLFHISDCTRLHMFGMLMIHWVLLQFTDNAKKERMEFWNSYWFLHRDKSNTPSGFTLKLRKHMRTRRLEDVRRLGYDRVWVITSLPIGFFFHTWIFSIIFCTFWVFSLIFVCPSSLIDLYCTFSCMMLACRK
jgi:hypothetical protein